MDRLESQKYTHIMFIDSFSFIEKSDSEFTFTRTGLYKPKNIICSSLFALFTLCIIVPFIIVLVRSLRHGLPSVYGVVKPFYDLEWWFFALVTFFGCCVVFCIILQALQLVLLPMYLRIYNIANGSICVQKNPSAVRTKSIKLDQNVRLEIKNDIECKSKYAYVYPSLDDSTVKSYGKEFIILIYCNNKLWHIVDSLFQAEVDIFLQAVQRNNGVQIKYLSSSNDNHEEIVASESDKKSSSNNNDNFGEVIASESDEKMTEVVLGVFDVCRFALTWIILFHIIFLPQTIFEKTWTKKRLNDVLKMYYTDVEIESQNIRFVKIHEQLLLSNGVQLPSKHLRYVHGYWVYMSLGVLVFVIILDVVLGKRNINFIKWFMWEFNKPLRQKKLFKRKWQLLSAYKRNKFSSDMV